MTTTTPAPTWNPSFTTAPPTSCYNLHWPTFAQTALWGETCDGDPDPACVPWNSHSHFTSVTACPSGWVSFPPERTVAASLAPGDSAFRCCPSGMSALTTGSLGWCVLESPSAMAFNRGCDRENSGVTGIGPEALGHVVAHGLSMWVGGTGSSTESGKGPPSETGTETGAGGGGGAGGSSRAARKGLSGAAKAGIGVVIPLIIIGIAAAVAFCLRRRKKRGEKKAGEPVAVGDDGAGYVKAELRGSDGYALAGNNGTAKGLVTKSELPVNEGASPVQQYAGWRSRDVVGSAELDGASKNAGEHMPTPGTTELPTSKVLHELANGQHLTTSGETRNPAELHGDHNTPWMAMSEMEQSHHLARPGTNPNVSVDGSPHPAYSNPAGTDYLGSTSQGESREQVHSGSSAVPRPSPLETGLPATDQERLAHLRERQAKLAKERDELERLRKLREEEKRLDEEIARLEKGV